MSKSTRPKVFMVTSQGYTATKWTAWALNQHPDIYCEHFLGATASDVDYTLPELKKLYDNGRSYRDDFKLRRLFADLRRQAVGVGKHYAGNVGAYSAYQLEEAYTGSVQGFFPTVNLIRHPLLWVASGSHQMLESAKVNPRVMAGVNHHMVSRSESYLKMGVPDLYDTGNKIFCYMCSQLMDLTHDARMPVLSHYRMEDVTSEPVFYAEMVRELTGLDVSGDQEYLRKVFDKGRVYSHNPERPETSQQQYKLWQPWQQEVYSAWMQESGINHVYTKLGYDMTLPTVRTTSRPRTLRKV